MPTALDFAFLFLFSVVLVGFASLVYFPRFKAAAMAGVPGVRRRAYRRTVIGQWACAAATLAIWIRADRSWTDLGLVPHGAWFWPSVAFVIPVILFSLVQARYVARASSDELAEVKNKLADVSFLLPRTTSEARWFAVLSVTAGVCEELLYRGYLVWVMRPWLGTVGALAFGVALFAVGHAYQGWRGVIKTGVAGAIMGAAVLGTGWLIPAMVLHVLIDLNAGIVGRAVFAERA